MKPALLIFLFFCCKESFAQNDVLLLKKKNGRVIDRFYSGKKISFRGHDMADHDGYIVGIKQDTIYFDYYMIRLMPTSTGGMWPDTVQTYHLSYDYRDITWVNYDRSELRGKKMAGYLQTGGLAIAAVGIINGFSRRNRGEKFFSGSYIIVAPALYIPGWLIKHTVSKRKLIGKKYTLQYIKLSGNKPAS